MWERFGATDGSLTPAEAINALCFDVKMKVEVKGLCPTLDRSHITRPLRRSFVEYYAHAMSLEPWTMPQGLSETAFAYQGNAMNVSWHPLHPIASLLAHECYSAPVERIFGAGIRARTGLGRLISVVRYI